jgi:hypothetical protein
VYPDRIRTEAAGIRGRLLKTWWLPSGRPRSAKPLFVGSIPTRASNKFVYLIDSPKFSYLLRIGEHLSAFAKHGETQTKLGHAEGYADRKVCKNQSVAVRGGKREGSGRPRKLAACAHCGVLLSAWERQRHKCPRWFRRVGRPRKAAPQTSAVPQLEVEYLQKKEERRKLLEFLCEWRANQGVGSSARILSNRSLAQLRKMRDQLERGMTYRTGRRWRLPRS